MDLTEPKPLIAIEAKSPQQGMMRVPVERVSESGTHRAEDVLAVEEPLEIRLIYHDGFSPVQKSISITMRTPGHDFDLACGFLLSEGIVRGREQIASVRHLGQPEQELQLRNVVRVELRPGIDVDLERLERHFYTTSSCGVCGKTSLAAIEATGLEPLVGAGPQIACDVLYRLPATLRRAQNVFEQTGGLHAAALFDPPGQLVAVREDVGRHNAVDKVIGSELLAGRLPLAERILLVSGRASFELVQKALAAGIPILAAVGAPSSLAVELAQRNRMTLIGFLRNGRFNIYCGAARIAGVAPS